MVMPNLLLNVVLGMQGARGKELITIVITIINSIFKYKLIDVKVTFRRYEM